MTASSDLAPVDDRVRRVVLADADRILFSPGHAVADTEYDADAPCPECGMPSYDDWEPSPRHGEAGFCFGPGDYGSIDCRCGERFLGFGEHPERDVRALLAAHVEAES